MADSMIVRPLNRSSKERRRNKTASPSLEFELTNLSLSLDIDSEDELSGLAGVGSCGPPPGSVSGG
ncbi:MAG: hypothetical protein C0507_16040 [Cyanobacteria bacterium PR.3.49]|nr:hypothetical protein [Cyanobacteria bacterium PR.3.49]